MCITNIFSRGKEIRNIPLIILFMFMSVLFSLKACEKEYEDTPFYEHVESISEYLYAKGDTFSSFRELITNGNLKQTLAAFNPHGNGYTLFLPTNDAFDRFVSEDNNYSDLQALLADTAFMNILSRYHIVNTGIPTNSFPFGALPDTTLSGDLLSIGYSGDIDSTIIRINNYASVIQPNIELSNGYIHVIDHVLEPVVYNTYEWLKQQEGYTIFVEALEITGLRDTFAILDGKIPQKYPAFTLFAEPDEVFNRKGIISVSDLISRYSPEETQYEYYSNGLYQFIAYHILEGKRFLNDFEGESTNYNTCASLPMSINGLGLDLKINPGVYYSDTVITGSDTSIIDYVKIDYDRSNNLTKNGAVHFLENILEITRPKSQQRIFQFYEEPVISAAHQQTNTYYFTDTSLFSIIKWHGVEELQYINSSASLPGVWNNDYLQIEGEFSISYEIPKILPGKYMLQIRANKGSTNNAFIGVILDGNIIMENIDLTGTDGSGSNSTLNIGDVYLDNYEKHTLEIKSLVPGRFSWDAVIFEPSK